MSTCTGETFRIWDKAEAMSADERSALQLRRLGQSLRQAAKVPFYSEQFRSCGFRPEELHSLDDLRKLPFTTKADLRERYPLQMLAVPREEVARLHASSGTTGKPTFVAYTKSDMNMWTEIVARFLTAGGLLPGHTVHIAFGYGLFTGGFGLHYGVERVGAAVLPAASGNTQRQIMLLRDLGSDAIVCTPSYALTIADTMRAAGIDPTELPLRFGHFGGEMWTEDMRVRIEKELGIKAFNNYGLSEVIGPGVSGECHCQNGMHIQEDHFIAECVDPDTLEPVPAGTLGELVFTSLTKEAMPIIRYRTRDMATLMPEPCPCGRTTMRMSRVVGRSDDMLILRGVNVYPSQIEEALLRIDRVRPHYMIEVDRPGNLDTVTVKVEIGSENFSDIMSEMQALRDRIVREIHAVTGVRMEVELVAPQTLERFEGKAKRVIDRRTGKDGWK